MREDREINGESTSVVWPTLESTTAEEQNRTKQYGVSRLPRSIVAKVRCSQTLPLTFATIDFDLGLTLRAGTV